MFDNLREDWQTYERDIARQGLWVMAVYRFGRWRYRL
jgi:serine O-acetyltransferase